MIDRLADGDITKHDAIYKQPYSYCLDLLSYWKAKDKYITYMNKQNKQR